MFKYKLPIFEHFRTTYNTETQQEIPLQRRKQFCFRGTALWDTYDTKVLLGNSEQGGEDADDREAEAHPGR